MEISAAFEDGALLIYRNDEIIYSINEQNLGDTLGEGSGISNWIHQLLEKKWASSALLYEVGYLIQKNCPNNRIDWKRSFYMVERDDYIKRSFEMKQNLEEGVEGQNDTNMLDYFKFAYSDKSPEIEEEILNITTQQLKQYNIIS